VAQVLRKCDVYGCCPPWACEDGGCIGGNWRRYGWTILIVLDVGGVEELFL